MMGASLLGMTPGIALAGMGVKQLQESHGKALKAMKTDLVEPKAFAKKHAPNLFVATTNEDIDKIPVAPIYRKALKSALSQMEGRNAGYVSIGDQKFILSPKLVNRSLLGHEIGHHIDLSKKKRSILDAVLQLPEERRAWEASPFQDEKSQRIGEVMKGTVAGRDKIIMGGIAAGAGATAFPLARLARKLLKK